MKRFYVYVLTIDFVYMTGMFFLRHSELVQEARGFLLISLIFLNVLTLSAYQLVSSGLTDRSNQKFFSRFMVALFLKFMLAVGFFGVYMSFYGLGNKNAALVYASTYFALNIAMIVASLNELKAFSSKDTPDFQSAIPEIKREEVLEKSEAQSSN